MLQNVRLNCIDMTRLMFPQGESVVMNYPAFGQLFIGLLLVSSVSCVPLTALYVYCRKRKRGSRPKRQPTVNIISAQWPHDDGLISHHHLTPPYLCPPAEHHNSASSVHGGMGLIFCVFSFLSPNLMSVKACFNCSPCKRTSFITMNSASLLFQQKMNKRRRKGT